MKLLFIALVLVLTSNLAGTQDQTLSHKSLDERLSDFNVSMSLEEISNIAHLRKSALDGNRLQIPAMLKILEEAEKPYWIYTTMRALCTMGVKDALPDIEKMIRIEGMSGDGKNIRNYVEVCRARLLAEAGTRNLPEGERKAKEKLGFFLKALELDVNAINSSTQKETRVAGLHMFPYLQLTRETMALREIADMIYRRRDKHLLSIVKKQELNFGVDKPAAMKILLALSSRNERIEWLTNELANVGAIYVDIYCTIQLAVDEGSEASHYAALKIREKMKTLDQPLDVSQPQDPKASASSGVHALLLVIHGLGDSTQEPLIFSLTKSPNRYVATYAQGVYGSVKDGRGCQYLFTF